MAADLDINGDIIYEFPPAIRVYKDGRFVRTTRESAVPASLDAATGVESKDIVIDPATGVMARLYLPIADKDKLPVVIYFHGGGFFLGSTFIPTFHSYLNRLSGRARALVVSIEYRLAPEHPIPAAYEDAALALDWVLSGSSDEWLTPREGAKRGPAK